ncbi:MAG: TonB-dependent receptor domain-containing protein [Paludibacter sp.]
MRKLFLSIIFLSVLFPLFALYTIKGKIVDSSTQAPIDFVNVALIRQNTETLAAGVTSDANGNFVLPQVATGKYTLKISFVGYNTIELPLVVTNKEQDLGVIKLLEDSKTLSEVQVVGQGSQMTFDIDKKVFSVDKNIASAGGSASDVLQNIPSVDVDGEGNVSLRSNSSVEVWINGKPSGLTADNRAQVLQQMPAESIEKVEIMTNPSAKFKPEGTSGIINIVLKKNRKAGYYGSVSAGLTYVDGAKISGNAGANINYSSSKIDAFANIGYRAMNFKGGGYTDRFGLSAIGDTTSVLNQTSDMKRGFGGFFARAGIDYHLNDKHTLSLSGFGMAGNGYSESLIDYKYVNLSNALLSRNYNRANTGDGDRPSINVSLDYKFDIDTKGSNLMSSLSYSHHSRTNSETIVQNESGAVNSDFSQFNEGLNKEVEFKLDYTKQFSDNKKLELGWATTGELRESPTSAYNNILNIPINDYFNNFTQNELINAAYATFGSRYGKLSYQAGLRAEHFIRDWTNEYYKNNVLVTDNSETYKSLEWFPSVFLGYTLPQNNELQLNVSRRIQRPRGREINPFRNYSDSTNISYGNPGLLPELSTAFEFNYIKGWDAHTLSASLYYRFTDNVMQQVQYLNGSTMESTNINLSKSTNIGAEIVSKNRLFKIVNLTSTLNLYYNKLDSGSYASIYDPSIITKTKMRENFSWNIRSMANIILGKNTFMQITGDYSAPRLLPQGKESSSYAIDLGLRQTFLNRNLSINLMVRDLLNSRKRTTFTYGNGYTQESQSYFSGRMIGLTATYNFGNMKPKQNAKKMNSSDMNMEGGMD